jgi:hypothetical protein
MGQACTLRFDMHFYDKCYRTLDEVEADIELEEKILNNAEKDLMQLIVMTEPAKFWRESEAEIGETPYIWMQNEAMQAIETIKESTRELDKLYTLAAYWKDTHNEKGNAIQPPKEDSNGAYFWGDYVDSDYPDGTVAFSMEQFKKELRIKLNK